MATFTPQPWPPKVAAGRNFRNTAVKSGLTAACRASLTHFLGLLRGRLAQDAGALLPVGVDFSHMYANKICDQATGQGLVQRELDRVFGGLVVLELVLQLLDRP